MMSSLNRLCVAAIRGLAFNASQTEEGEMFARHVTIKGDPVSMDQVVRMQHEVVLPMLRDCTGFKGSTAARGPGQGRGDRDLALGYRREHDGQ
jgi:hypothetical protein